MMIDNIEITRSIIEENVLYIILDSFERHTA